MDSLLVSQMFLTRMSYLLLILFLAMGLEFVIGGCHCCGACSLCSDGVETFSLDLEFEADKCNGTGCDDISGTYLLEQSAECAWVGNGEGGTCSTDECDSCDGVNNFYLYCCDGTNGEFCAARRDVPDAMACVPDTNGDTCNDTLGCEATASVNDPDATPACASNAACVDFAFIGDPGFSCEYADDCSCLGTCQGTSLTIQVTIIERDVGGTMHLILVVYVEDGWRASEAEIDLGAADSAECSTLESSGLTFTEVTEFPLPHNLCDLPTGSISSIPA